MHISDEQVEQAAESLLGMLYVNPELGPHVVAKIPSSAGMPDEAVPAYDAMLKWGIVDGRLNTAFFLADVKGDPFTTRFTSADAVAIHQSAATEHAVAELAGFLRNRHQNHLLQSSVSRMVDELGEKTGLSITENAGSMLAVLQGVLAEEESTSNDGSISAAAVEYGEMLDSWQAGDDPSYTPTHVPALDRLINGWRKSHFTLVCGFSSGGKSLHMIDCLVRHGLWSIQNDNVFPAVAFSCEMPATALVERMIANITGISSAKFRPNAEYPATESEWAKYRDAIELVKQFPVIIRPESAPSLDFIRSTIAHIKAKYGGISSVWVDYLEKVAAKGEGEGRVAAIAEGLTDIFKTFDVPGIVYSQYNRTGKDRASTSAPQDTWIRGSGKPEQEAYTIIHISWVGYFTERGLMLPEHLHGKTNSDVCMCVTKNRGGTVGTVWLRLDAASQRWYDPSEDGFLGANNGSAQYSQSSAVKYSL